MFMLCYRHKRYLEGNLTCKILLFQPSSGKNTHSLPLNSTGLMEGYKPAKFQKFINQFLYENQSFQINTTITEGSQNHKGKRLNNWHFYAE